MTPAIYAINRAEDTARMAALSASAEAAGLALTRIEAFDGHDPNTPLFLYRDLIGERFWGEDRIKPGALGCYLSHIAAWRRLIADGQDWAVIVEDDLTFDPAAAERIAGAAGLADLVFLNARMADWRAAARLGDGAQPITEIFAALDANGVRIDDGAMAKAPGADAYLLTAEGARRLLADTHAQKIECGVDWAMLAAACPTHLRPDWLEWAALRDRASLDPPLSAAVAADPIGTLQAEAPSTIRHSETRVIADLFSGPELRAPGAEGTGVAMPEGPELDPVFQAFAAGRFYESPALELLRRWMPPGGVFVDVGAHVGGHTFFMLRHGGAGRAAPVEFARKSIEMLRAAAEENGLSDQIDDRALGIAFGDERRKLERMGPKKIPSAARLRPGFVETVPVRPGDAVLRELPVDLIKVDVNGEEKMVLQGLKKTLKRKRPLVALDLSRPKTEKALPFLLRQHYREAERVTWEDAQGPRAFAIFTPLPLPKAQDAANAEIEDEP